MSVEVLTNGYVSMDHIIKISSPACVGHTSIVTNADCAEVNYGGCAVNIAVSLSRLGRRAMPILRVGKDWEKNGFKAYLEESGVSLEGTQVLEGETTSTCYLIEQPDGDHITCYYPGSMDGKYAGKPGPELFDGVRLGVITVGSTPDNAFFLDECLRRQIPVAFGMRIDPDAFPVPFLKRLLKESAFLFANETEWAYVEELYHGFGAQDLMPAWASRTVVVTEGAEGSLCYEKTPDGIRVWHIPAYPVEKVVDATGAGDAYMAGFFYGWLRGESAKRCCCLGSALSSFILEAVGCTTNVPQPAALEKRAEVLENQLS